MTSKRTISSLNQAAAAGRVVRPVLFGRFDFSSGVRRFHTLIGPRDATHPVHGSETYTGIGDFGGIAAELTESLSNSPQAVRVALTGVKTAFLNIALDDDYHRRDAELLFGFDDESGELIDDPVVLWSGFMDKAEISLEQHTAELLLTCESRATSLQSASGLRFTDEDLQAAYSGDLAGEYIYRMPDLVLQWGNDTLQQTSGGGGRGGFRLR